MNEEMIQQETQTPTRPLEVITAEIRYCKQQAGNAILEIGRRLIEAKAQLGHGEWLDWLGNEVEFSEATAQRFMRLAKAYPNPSPVTDLGASKALALLALPDSERERFVAEKHEVNGQEKTVQEMSKRELEQAIRERDEARSKQCSAEGTASKLRQDLSDLTAERDRAAKRADQAENDLRAAEEQLKELREKPQEVVVKTVVDEQAVASAADAARKETEDKLRRKIDNAKTAQKKAEDEKTRAEQALASARAEATEAAALAEKEKGQLTKEAERLRKKLAMASSGDVTVFKAHFDLLQQTGNKLLETLDKMEDAITAAKLRGALLQLLELLRSEAQRGDRGNG